MLVLFNGGALPSGDEYCAVVVAAIKSNAGKSARSGNSATRGGRGDMRARNKIEFRKGGVVGRVKETMLLRYLSLSFSVFFLFLLHLCSFDPGIFGRMKFGFEVNPLVRNQSRPHRITRVATENGFRDFKRVVELRFTEGNRDRSEQGRKGKRNLENARHAATTHIERTCIVEISPLQTKANFIRACRSLLSTTKI